MRWLWGTLLFSLALQAQDDGPQGIVRGELLEWDAAALSGELSIRAADNHVFRFLFDTKTYFERENQRVSAGRLKKSDMLEIVSDKVPGLTLHYARTVHVIERPAPPRPPMSLGRVRLYRSPIEHIIPLGNLSFAGLVSRVDSERLVLRTRLDGEKTIYLRRDTRYLGDGYQVEASSLKPNTRVFIRASKNFEDEIEAYQIIWGEILQPGPH